MTEYVEHEAFTLTRVGGNFHVRYSFKPTDDGGCHFTYCEWVDEGELAEVFEMGAMETLKRVIEELSTSLCRQTI